ncbi:hypothetical protein BD311DRAFT_797688 [Dichomitus squalens]|uniref:Uncharacterized protein n=1 Tax=Dichomitus squalens TaxID=114155 RepID=A0A4Q9MJ50_9APHY|nr:hypothetical protein BD311DRAFT_797688 [Dichomitus squalens]
MRGVGGDLRHFLKLQHSISLMMPNANASIILRGTYAPIRTHITRVPQAARPSRRRRRRSGQNRIADPGIDVGEKRAYKPGMLGEETTPAPAATGYRACPPSRLSLKATRACAGRGAKFLRSPHLRVGADAGLREARERGMPAHEPWANRPRRPSHSVADDALLARAEKEVV